MGLCVASQNSLHPVANHFRPKVVGSSGLFCCLTVTSTFAGKTGRNRAVLNRILFEQTSNESRIEVGSYFYNPAVGESAKPAVPVIEPEPVLRGGLGMQLHHGPVFTYERMFHVQLRALR